MSDSWRTIVPFALQNGKPDAHNPENAAQDVGKAKGTNMANQIRGWESEKK